MTKKKNKNLKSSKSNRNRKEVLDSQSLVPSPEIAISVHNLSKKYRLYDSPQHRLKEALHPFRKKYHRDFWALRDVSFEVKKGETFGIIGKNGSGKSTLLQILCGVLQPSKGEITVNGKVSALLELGAGFNPEFTGRQNVYLNGALMGYAKEEMDERFEMIADFADIGDFIEQPVKTYSSGMYVRLAFAAAVNVDPEILVVDEALAVGDMRFQQKCFRKMREFKERGSTILHVTHDMGAVKSSCDRVVWIDEGAIYQIGTADDVVKNYTSYMFYDAIASVASDEKISVKKDNLYDLEIQWEQVSSCASYGEGGAEIKGVTLYTKDDFKKTNLLKGRAHVCLMLDILIKKNIYTPIIGFILNDRYGNHILGTNSYVLGKQLRSFKQGERILADFEFMFPGLMDGEYTFSVAIAEGTQHNHVQHHWVHDAYILQVVSNNEATKLGCYIIPEDAEISIKSSG